MCSVFTILNVPNRRETILNSVVDITSITVILTKKINDNDLISYYPTDGQSFVTYGAVICKSGDLNEVKQYLRRDNFYTGFTIYWEGEEKEMLSEIVRVFGDNVKCSQRNNILYSDIARTFSAHPIGKYTHLTSRKGRELWTEFLEFGRELQELDHSKSNFSNSNKDNERGGFRPITGRTEEIRGENWEFVKHPSYAERNERKIETNGETIRNVRRNDEKLEQHRDVVSNNDENRDIASGYQPSAPTPSTIPCTDRPPYVDWSTSNDAKPGGVALLQRSIQPIPNISREPPRKEVLSYLPGNRVSFPGDDSVFKLPDRFRPEDENPVLNYKDGVDNAFEMKELDSLSPKEFEISIPISFDSKEKEFTSSIEDFGKCNVFNIFQKRSRSRKCIGKREPENYPMYLRKNILKEYLGDGVMLPLDVLRIGAVPLEIMESKDISNVNPRKRFEMNMLQFKADPFALVKFLCVQWGYDAEVLNSLLFHIFTHVEKPLYRLLKIELDNMLRLARERKFDEIDVVFNVSTLSKSKRNDIRFDVLTSNVRQEGKKKRRDGNGLRAVYYCKYIYSLEMLDKSLAKRIMLRTFEKIKLPYDIIEDISVIRLYLRR
uniref:Uncharacterized protein n=1 Tax=Anagyrus vladimiri reovirus TaxID=2992174 RepID=A0A9E8AH49_9REOV|nr:hypothetical protein [Anagyrus vladimiri reovirus]